MNKGLLSLIFTLFYPLTGLAANAPVMVFDLGQTVTSTSMFHAALEIGLGRFINYGVRGYSFNEVSKKLFTFIESADPRTEKEKAILAKERNQEQRAHAHWDIEPKLMCDWHTNAKSPKQIKRILLKHLKTYPAPAAEKELLKGIVTMMFTPKKYINTTILIPEMVQFMQDCKALGCPIYLLTNWEAESYDLLMKKFPHLQQLADGAVVSGKCRTLKPEPEIYEDLGRLMLEQGHGNLTDTVFLDDRAENLEAARNNHGMTVIDWSTPENPTPKVPNMALVKTQFIKILRDRGLHDLAEAYIIILNHRRQDQQPSFLGSIVAQIGSVARMAAGIGQLFARTVQA